MRALKVGKSTSWTFYFASLPQTDSISELSHASSAPNSHPLESRRQGRVQLWRRVAWGSKLLPKFSECFVCIEHSQWLQNWAREWRLDGDEQPESVLNFAGLINIWHVTEARNVFHLPSKI